MTFELSADLRQAIEAGEGAPVYLVDSATNTSYVLLRAEQFEKVKALLGKVEDHFDPSVMYPFVEQSFRRAGWDDPEMDDYNAYDENRQKR